jgi:hypothetical protein
MILPPRVKSKVIRLASALSGYEHPPSIGEWEVPEDGTLVRTLKP